ncbi:MAG: hypothetical protein HY298_03615 [Verrucomicrobia bacterium]|nr:hypothetical protein [Verrucomicrobiota bacterium]
MNLSTRKLIKTALIASAVTELLVCGSLCISKAGVGRLVFSLGHFPGIYLATQWPEVLEQTWTTFFVSILCTNLFLLFLLYLVGLLIWKRNYGTPDV